MRDYKATAQVKVKKNKVRRERQPRDWRGLLQKTLRCVVTAVSAVLIVGAAVIAARMLVASDYFRIETVRVENAVRVSAEEVVDLSDILVGSSIFELNLDMIGRRIEENPWVKTARVNRIFPREIAISLEEREPRAIINLGYLYYLDGGGEVFKLLSNGDRLDYPVITGIERSDILEQPEKTRARLHLALALLDELEQRRRFNLDSISELHLHPDEGIAVFTYIGGVAVHFGEGDFARKLDRLEHIYKELEPRLTALEYIDLKVPDRVIVKIDNNQQRARG
ncbi:cell division protein FtsQ/DivIB [Geoalkalibacter halelectricus]|uniref:Cell division protein FtsQ n=1 Tax=Geoalkalibacter halelectricus TaxID=2847045 RepID=A0ABY5ZL21_9BACT|nr:FtsQ-type POTRA domain-containing protein [Geoalkalibacter halelectricus]MDO3378833.1 FtsQ-type POTRA domain-containing protein [Geoalkalibacter halelectricus]UWZ79862.1 FtsQ-type POTRA domain-containing protein [Geoalkalibacter halelectricus]